MKLMEFVQQMQRSAGDPSGDEHFTGTVLQYVNEEIDAVIRDFPEKASFVWETASSSYYHTIDFTGFPVVRVTEIIVGGIGADKKRWKDLKGRIGNVV